jgi:general L-amino acid transport system substrate-binding protein
VRRFLTYGALALAIIVLCCQMRASDKPATLARVRASGVLRCGIDVEQAEYSTSDDHGNRQAFDADLCRAVGVAVLGKNAQITMMHFPDDRTSMQALTNGDVDLIATLTDDFTHGVGTHIEFTRPVLWDGVGFLLPANSKVTTARQLTGKKICFIAETTEEESLRAWFDHEHLSFVPFPFQEEGEMQAAFATGNCGALAGDQTRLAQLRTALFLHQQRSRLLPDRISKDPLASATLDNDPKWAAIVNWVMEALVQAEESGVTKRNVSRMRALAASPECVNPTLRFLLGGSHEIGSALQLEDDWVVQVIGATGNYGEIYERNLGAASGVKLPRGENKLRAGGGMMMALPLK